MIAYVYRPRRLVGGKLKVARLYRARYRLDGQHRMAEIPLKTTDKVVAKQKLERILLEKQQEAVGILAPKSLRDAAQSPLLDHLDAFIKDLGGRKLDAMYVYNIEKRLQKLITQCRWEYIRDVSADAFVRWRSEQKKAAKTLNDYLDAISEFFNWMLQQEKVLKNPLKGVGRVETRGNEVRKRRASNDDELRRLLAVAGQRKAAYVTAMFTGLRRDELETLQWGKVNLDAVKPFLLTRSSTSKNHKEEVIWLHKDVVTVLREIRPQHPSSSALVFGHVPSMDELRADLQAADIPYKDEEGRQADFHSLRHTFNTNMAKAGVHVRLAMQLMRHSDIKLTTKVYTDAVQLPTAGAIEMLPSVLDADTQIDPQKIVPSGLGASTEVHESQNGDVQKSTVIKGESHTPSASVTSSPQKSIGCRTRIRT